MTHEESLTAHFKSIGLTDVASNWLLIVWRMIQAFDDFADGDEVTRPTLDRLISDSFFAYATHPYFVAHGQMLAPLVLTAFFKWKASDTAERAGTHNAVSFVWRAGFYDLVIMAMYLDNGSEYTTENSHIVMGLYGEKFADYMGEFSHA